MDSSKSTSKPISPFNWRENKEPTIFAKDPYFRPKAGGKTNSQLATQSVETRRANGDDPSKLYLIGNRKTEEERMLAYRQFGVYSRAEPSIKRSNKHEK